MVQIEHLEKTYQLKGKELHAVNDVSLTIGDGEIYGIIGYSGAGKSTLVRCLNFLEIPDHGSITIGDFGKISSENGKLSLTKDGKTSPLSEKKLRELRSSIGMIFQHFNLLDRSTVFENIAYPLKYRGISKAEIEKRVDELLDMVGLTDKKYVYPSQLSVAIARALSNSPKILLSDEATSALDPDATESILRLLKELKAKLGITIILITHEMAVIKSIADKVAVMERGKVVEVGDVYEVFAHPKQPITQKFVQSSSSLGNITKLIENDEVAAVDTPEKKLIKLTFTRESVDNALISQVSRKFNVDLNIVLANIDIITEDALGNIIVTIQGPADSVREAIDYIHSRGVETEVITHA